MGADTMNIFQIGTDGDLVMLMGRPVYISGIALLKQDALELFSDQLRVEESVIGAFNTNDYGVGLVESILFLRLMAIVQFLADYMNKVGGGNRLPTEQISLINLVLVKQSVVNPLVYRWRVDMTNKAAQSVLSLGVV